MIIPKSLSSQREKYYIKDLYCFNCQKTTKHIEVKDLDMLIKKLEYKDKLDDIEISIYNLIKQESDIKNYE